MSKLKKFIIITTINGKTEAIKKFSEFSDWELIIVGDKKSIPIKNHDNITFLSVQDQQNLNFKLVDVLPYNHYSRKNIGYLYAMKEGADIIYDSDDDNFPLPTWKVPLKDNQKIIQTTQPYFNIYKYFSNKQIWPRGFPLDEITIPDDDYQITDSTVNYSIGISQGLVNNDPDVDAIYRLLHKDNTNFDYQPPICLPKNVYCPINSQNTFWYKEAFPFMYLPISVSFRFTDILRGYIAQRMIWEQNQIVEFLPPDAIQYRNDHNLMHDFAQEVEMYNNIKDIVQLMQSMKFAEKTFRKLIELYEQLCNKSFVKQSDVDAASAWLSDFENITGI